jgi:putative oxidoreductase
MKTPPTNPSWGLTVLRLVVGSVFLVHGAQKLFQVGLARLAGIFGSLHIPLPLVSAVFATLVEFVGGIALLLGVFTRWAAALIASDMLVAVLVTYLEPGFFKKAGIELPITPLAAGIALALSGPGAASLGGTGVLSRKHV